MYQKMMNLGCFFVVAVFLLQVASDTLILGFPQAVTLNRICLFCPNYNIPRVPLQNCCGLFLKAVNQRSEDNHLLLSSTSADSTVKAVYFLSILSAIPWREMQYLLVLFLFIVEVKWSKENYLRYSPSKNYTLQKALSTHCLENLKLNLWWSCIKQIMRFLLLVYKMSTENQMKEVILFIFYILYSNHFSH